MKFVHRGILNKHSSENSFKSLKEVIDQKLNFETDIHFSKRNDPICYHDFNLKRLHQKNKLTKNLSQKDLVKFKIPTLKKIVKYILKKNIYLIEIKPILNLQTLSKLWKTIKSKTNNIVLISFKEKNLTLLKKFKPKLNLGLNLSLNNSRQYILKKIRQNNYKYYILDKSFLNFRKLKKYKKKIIFFTIKSKSEFKRYNKKFNLIYEGN